MLQRHTRITRWFHTGIYATTIVLLGTGWWLDRGQEGKPSALARVLDLPDVQLHRRVGWFLTGLGALGVTAGIRGAIGFVRHTFQVNRGDGRWFLRWPAGALTGRFAPHRGRYDPGQRLANLAFVILLGTLVATGIALTELKGGSTFVWVLRTHRYATYALTPLAIGHVLLAVGLLPGYRGAWRSMHWGGKVRRETAERLWPETVADDDED